jgi:endonuclease/exonuclease/phosphatase family metal-dependent hydrolase
LEPQDLKVMTFNVGLLRWRILGLTVFESPPFLKERFGQIPEAIKACGAGIVALQEIYEEDHVRALVEYVAEVYPYVARADNTARARALQFHNGLMFLSKYPIDGFTLRRHTHSAGLEKLVGSKSCLSCRFSTPWGPLALVNMHATVGGGADSEDADVDVVRESELEEAMELCAEAAKEGYTPAIIGDLNMGPESSPGNYLFMAARGYEDAVMPFVESVGCTWDPRFNNLPVYTGCTPQRLDHLFFKQGGKFRATAAKKVFSEHSVSAGPSSAPRRVPLSDHSGLVITLRTASDLSSSASTASGGDSASTCTHDGDSAGAQSPL